MKIIRTTMLTLLMMVSLNVFAQKINPKAKEMLDERLSEITEVMDLDDAQQAKLKELNLKVHFERQNARKQHEKGSDAFKNANKVITKKYHEDLRAFCSNEQVKAYFTYKKKRSQKEK